MKKAKITSIFKTGSRRLTKCLMINFFLSLIRTTPTSRMTNPTCNTKEIQSIRYIFIANHSNDKKYIKILHYVKGEIYVYMLHIHCLKSVFGSIFQKRRRKVIASTRDSIWIEVKVKKKSMFKIIMCFNITSPNKTKFKKPKRIKSTLYLTTSWQ